MNRLTRIFPRAALLGLAFAVLAAPDSLKVTVPLLPDTGSGPVIANIEADGKELWKSPVLKTGVQAAFNVSVKDEKFLVLRMHAVKGIDSAHRAWFEPLLER